MSLDYSYLKNVKWGANCAPYRIKRGKKTYLSKAEKEALQALLADNIAKLPPGCEGWKTELGKGDKRPRKLSTKRGRKSGEEKKGSEKKPATSKLMKLLQNAPQLPKDLIAEKPTQDINGRVMQYVDHETGEVLAVKRIEKTKNDEDLNVAREVVILEEVRKFCQQYFICVPKVALYQDADAWFIVMMDLTNDHAPLDKTFTDNKRPVQQKLDLCDKLIKAVFAMHAHGIYHRDLNAHHIMVDSSDEDIRIIDFGQAVMGKGKFMFTKLPKVDYLPPEMAIILINENDIMTRKFTAAQTRQLDYWQLGLVLLQILIDDGSKGELLEYIYPDIEDEEERNVKIVEEGINSDAWSRIQDMIRKQENHSDVLIEFLEFYIMPLLNVNPDARELTIPDEEDVKIEAEEEYPPDFEPAPEEKAEDIPEEIEANEEGFQPAENLSAKGKKKQKKASKKANKHVKFDDEDEVEPDPTITAKRGKKKKISAKRR